MGVVLNAKGWDSLLNQMKRSFKDIVPVLLAASNIHALPDIDNHFQAQKGENKSWPALSSTTEARRRRGTGKNKKRGNKILQDTGKLIGSILPASVVNRNTVSIKTGSHVKYAAAHNYGYPKRNIPERQFMWLSDKAREKIEQEVIDFSLRGF